MNPHFCSSLFLQPLTKVTLHFSPFSRITVPSVELVPPHQSKCHLFQNINVFFRTISAYLTVYDPQIVRFVIRIAIGCKYMK